MKLTNVIATLACATLCALAVNANAADVNKPTMQHYVFKYNFNKKVDPVLKSTAETQQHVQYEVALDVLLTAHNNINSTYNDLTMVASTQGTINQLDEQIATTE